MHSIIPLPALDSMVSIARIDLIDPLISGNKWYKLKYNLAEALDKGFTRILTFGGAYSNHIYATAAAAKRSGLESIGIIRGEETLPLNPTLKFATDNGMKLCYISRSEYRDKKNPIFIKTLVKKFGRFYLIPEGGTNELALKGVTEIINEIDNEYDYWITPVGTGGTLAGLVNGLNDTAQVIGISSLKGALGLEEDIKSLLGEIGKEKLKKWEINHEYHFGGYAKMNHELFDFTKKFKLENDVLLDPIYTSKMMYGIYDLIRRGYFPSGSKILALHTGGIQGWHGMEERYPFTKDFLTDFPYI